MNFTTNNPRLLIQNTKLETGAVRTEVRDRYLGLVIACIFSVGAFDHAPGEEMFRVMTSTTNKLKSAKQAQDTINRLSRVRPSDTDPKGRHTMVKMTKREFESTFRKEFLPLVRSGYESRGRIDAAARRECWSDAVEMFIKDGLLPARAADWCCPW